MKKFILVSFLSLSVLFISLFAVATRQSVEATVPLDDWSCVSSGPQCGTNEGTEYVCPEGYSRFFNTCKKWVETTYTCDVDAWIHLTKYDVSSFYNKPTGDDNHCHRIVWGNLTSEQQDAFKDMHHNDENYSTPNNGNWTSAYNSHIDQNPEADVDVSGHYEFTDEVAQSCTAGEPRYDSCEEAGQCGEECGITEPYSVPDGQGGYVECQATEACRGFCEDEEALNYKKEGACEYPPEVPGEPVPAHTFTHPSTSEAPSCGSVAPVLLPFNVHVLRAGSDATVKAFVPEGNAVQIYYKELGATDWQFADRDVPVSGGFVERTIHLLDPNKGYVFGLAAANSCAQGELVAVV